MCVCPCCNSHLCALLLRRRSSWRASWMDSFLMYPPAQTPSRSVMLRHAMPSCGIADPAWAPRWRDRCFMSAPAFSLSSVMLRHAAPCCCATDPAGVQGRRPGLFPHLLSLPHNLACCSLSLRRRSDGAQCIRPHIPPPCSCSFTLWHAVPCCRAADPAGAQGGRPDVCRRAGRDPGAPHAADGRCAQHSLPCPLLV
jgi:hypothetical protein